MVWGSIHCAVSLPRELENLAVPSRAKAVWERVQEAVRCAVPGTFFRRISILLSIEGVPREPGLRVEKREWERARFFEISLTESHLVSFLGELLKSMKVQLALALTVDISAGRRKLVRLRKPNAAFDLCAALTPLSGRAIQGVQDDPVFARGGRGIGQSRRGLLGPVRIEDTVAQHIEVAASRVRLNDLARS